jgi:hypothetical protein
LKSIISIPAPDIINVSNVWLAARTLSARFRANSGCQALRT